MEYSPMMVVMLWALTPSDCWPTGEGPGEQARVVEMPQPIMSVHPEGAYFTFNHGRPFLAERDPLTGAVDSNIKTTPVTSDDYLYEEYEESGESIDRKDSTKIYTRNDISSSSKDSDLHKFLNLPVHYSSSGKFPLISSSYANTKVQGHGPLSNHKLYSSSTSTTSTVSPSYYPLKTTAASTTTTKITTTSTSTTSPTTTVAPSTTEPSSTVFTTMPSTTKKPLLPTKLPLTTARTTTSTTTKPFFHNYDYEYEYDYDKSDGDGTEKTSHDYEFLGASSEVTKSYEKPFPSTSSAKPITTLFSRITPNNSQTISTLTSMSSTTSKTTTIPEKPKTTPIDETDTQKINPISSTERQQENISMKPSLAISTNQEDTVDLRPPKPELSVELRPPLAHPIRPYSSVVNNKHHHFGQVVYHKFPETPLIVSDKKPINVYSPQNSSKIKFDIVPTPEQPNKGSTHHYQDKQNSTFNTQVKPVVVQFTQKRPEDKDKYENSQILVKPNKNNSETLSNISYEITKQSTTQDKVQGIIIRDKHPVSAASTADSSLGNLEKHKNIAHDKDRIQVFEHINSQSAFTIDHNIKEEQLAQSNKKQEIKVPVKVEHVRPQGVSSESTQPNRVPSSGYLSQEQRPILSFQGHINPSSILYEDSKSQTTLQIENNRPQKPLGTSQENTRIHLKPVSRPQTDLLPNNNKPLIYYSSENNRPTMYPGMDPNRPQNHVFGLRITERPQVAEIDRPSGIDHIRPHIIRIPEGKPHVITNEQKKSPITVDVRPLQGMIGGEVNLGDNTHRPEGSTKPVIFPKPQLDKRPDYNAVQFGQPSKIENHFISVSPGHDNPSYSLQTSFSIGVPPPEQKQPPSNSQGVGQVLFPDEDLEKRPQVWPQHMPPHISQSEHHPNFQLEKYPRPPWESHLKPPHIYYKKEPFPSIKRKPLPNILPQFRPNAKVGHAEPPHIYLKPREPYDTLQPPPLPRPQFLRLEQDLEETKPLVHRRNGQTSSRVTSSLQMMQGTGSIASKRAALRVEDNNDKNEPVFVVYPSNGNSAPASPSDGVVVGTRGPQRPLPPDNLDIGDDLDSFPLDNNKNFQARVDTPVLKSKSSTSKPPIKNEFPYALIKPNPDDRVTTGSVVTKEYTAFSPTVPSIEKEHDTEINIIPYLQDYMPFATKKPQHKDSWVLGIDIKHHSTSIGSKQTGMEVSQTSIKSENHKVVSEGPQPQDFQAPFHASLTAPSQGWSVVQKKPSKEKNNAEENTTIKELNEIPTTEEPKFDIQNFKPQLFGGFKPIAPPVENENKENLRL